MFASKAFGGEFSLFGTSVTLSDDMSLKKSWGIELSSSKFLPFQINEAVENLRKNIVNMKGIVHVYLACHSSLNAAQ